MNSIRQRLDHLLTWLQECQPDIVCLQEIKCREGEYPLKAFQKAGYEHVEIAGQKGYHGVATVSRYPLQRLDTPEFCMHGEARGVAVKVRGVEVHNLYVPAGGDEPDPEINPKFAHKLDFIDRMGTTFTKS